MTVRRYTDLMTPYSEYDYEEIFGKEYSKDMSKRE
jgi:hypothetical protein